MKDTKEVISDYIQNMQGILFFEAGKKAGAEGGRL